MKKFGLSIDGGGVGGIGPASWLAKADLPSFDFGAGTSVGSMVIAMLATGCKSSLLPEEFDKRARDIFCRPGMEWELDPRKPKFNSIGLERALKDVLGSSTKISDTLFPVFIVTHDWALNQPKVYDSTDSELLWEVVAESCSAPTYFPPRNGKADGGTIANNPSMCGITGYESKYEVDFKDMAMISLGTGGNFWKDPCVTENTNKLEWAELLLSNPTRANSTLATFQAQRILKDAYLRIEPILSADYEMSNVDFMPEYAKIWESLHELRKDDVGRFILKQFN